MHPLSDNLKSLPYEELEKRSSLLAKRMEQLRRIPQANPLIWDQLQLLWDELQQEKQERAWSLNQMPDSQHVVVSTDPLPDDPVVDTKPVTNRNFTPIS